MAVYNKKDFLVHADSVVPTDFKRMGNEPYYVKRVVDRELRMLFSLRQYYPHSVVIRGIMVNVYIDAIENIFDEVLRISPLADYTSNEKKDTIGGGGYNISGVNYALLDVQDVEDDTTFAIVLPELEKIVDGALQFYNTFSTLQAIHGHLETLPLMQMGNFLQQPMPYRRMILKKLVEAPDYETYAQSIINHYTSENLSEEIAFATTLKAKLDSL
ncbi:hypothetical protein [Flagellimonas onchidii]|uniref:hypothetical protein n=1 Tax=Flagellimonas onchidii TaxID=2562684 RepID=UPI0010A6A577|nr:hypothetical protein [Allomuricauda onchidii]